MKHEIKKILNIADKTYYNWRKTKPIVALIEKYFSKNDLAEFLENKTISKLEKLNQLQESHKILLEYYCNIIDEIMMDLHENGIDHLVSIHGSASEVEIETLELYRDYMDHSELFIINYVYDFLHALSIIHEKSKPSSIENIKASNNIFYTTNIQNERKERKFRFFEIIVSEAKFSADKMAGKFNGLHAERQKQTLTIEIYTSLLIASFNEKWEKLDNFKRYYFMSNFNEIIEHYKTKIDSFQSPEFIPPF